MSSDFSQTPIGTPNFDPQFLVNPEPRCPVVVLIDRSYSMAGTPLAEACEGFNRLRSEIQSDTLADSRVEMVVMFFAGGVTYHCQDFKKVSDIPRIRSMDAGASTETVEALKVAIQAVKNRVSFLKGQGIACFRPWVVLITDGAPTSKPDSVADLQQTILNDEISGPSGSPEYNLWVIGCGDVNENAIVQLSQKSNPPKLLRDMDFASLFKWLSVSLRSVSRSTAFGRKAKNDVPGMMDIADWQK